MMTLTHDAIFPRLSEYLDGELPAPENAAVKEHLAQCATCEQGLSELVAALDAVHALRRPPDAAAWAPVREAVRSAAARAEPDRFWALNLPQLFPSYAGAALASALLIALGAMLFPLMRRQAARKSAGMVMVRLEPPDEGVIPQSPAAASVSAAASAPEGALARNGGRVADKFDKDATATRASGPVVMADSKLAQEREKVADSEALQRREAAGSSRIYSNTGSKGGAAKTEAMPSDEVGALEKRKSDAPAPAAKAAAPAAAAPAPPAKPEAEYFSGEPGRTAPGSVISSDTRYRITPQVAVESGEEGARRGRESDKDLASARADDRVPAAQPAEAEKKQRQNRGCTPAAPVFPAFPNVHPSDHIRLPLEFDVRLDGGGHVVDVDYAALPGQQPLANEIAAWLRRQTVHPMICNGSGVEGWVKVSFSWEDGSAP